MRIFLSDFDGTIVNEDILDVVCEITNHRAESEFLNQEIITGKKTGLDNLIKRINFLNGVSKQQIFDKLNDNNYLVLGAIELFKFLKENDFIVVLHTGNIEYVAEYYKNLLNIDHIVCTKPYTQNDKIIGIDNKCFNDKDFKVNGCLEIIKKYNIDKNNIYAIGDSIVDKNVFNIAGHSIAINSKGGIDDYADFVIKNNSLLDAITFIKNTLK